MNTKTKNAILTILKKEIEDEKVEVQFNDMIEGMIEFALVLSDGSGFLFHTSIEKLRLLGYKINHIGGDKHGFRFVYFRLIEK